MKMKINDLIKTDTVEKWQVCGIVVQCMVSKLGIIQSELSKLPDTEIHAVNEENGKIVAVMQANSQKELANRIGTKKSYISRIENGHTDIQLSTLFRIFAGLGRRITFNVL